MWDFSISKTLGIMIKTMPFILLRMAIYFGIALGYVIVTGSGAGIGYGVGNILGDGGPETGAVYGGIGGFAVMSIALYWIREYILYMVKAGHIAVMVKLLDGEQIPDGKGQINYAQSIVRERFAEANILFALDQLIKGVVRAINGLLQGITSFIPIPGLQGLMKFIGAIIRMATTFIDEIILGYNIRLNSQNPYETARSGLVLYAQNGKTFIKNAIWLTLLQYLLSFVIFLIMIVPAGAIVYFFPGEMGGWAFVIAIIFALSFKAAIIEPFAICALMSVYFKVIEGQTPNPEWEAKLDSTSEKFRSLKDKAMSGMGFGGTKKPDLPDMA